MQISIQEAAAVFALFAAVFSYLSWITLVRTSKDDFEERVRNRFDANFTTGDIDARIGFISVRQNDTIKYRLKRYTPFGNFDSNCLLKIVINPSDVYGKFESIPEEEVVRDALTKQANERLVHYDAELVDREKAQLMLNIVCRNPDILYDDVSELLTEFGENTEISVEEPEI